ncbi:hypothetical protein [Cetobacterium sp.]|uniref:hypothetical protein n=1 Tax=Cetobacterium sp. TaxID=2071632 RepID=UPI003F3D2C31
MLKKIEKYKEIVEEIARLEKELLLMADVIIQTENIDELKKENKKISKLKEERDNYKAVQINLLDLFKREKDNYITQLRDKLGMISADHKIQHDELHREIAEAINKFVVREKEINSSYSKKEAELEEKRIVEFLSRVSGQDYWNNFGTTGLSNRIARIKQKLVNPMSVYGI